MPLVYSPKNHTRPALHRHGSESWPILQPCTEYGVVRNEAVLSWPLIVAGSRAEMVGAVDQSACGWRSSTC